MTFVDIDKTKGDLQILALAVQALIETHPNKEAFKEKFLEIIKSPQEHSLYSPKTAHPCAGQLLQDLLRTASHDSRVDSLPANDRDD